MDDLFFIFLGITLFAIVQFWLLRIFWLWYWKINERVDLQHKTTYLLELIATQLGVYDTQTLTVLNESTGKISQIKLDAWIEFRRKNPNATGYRILKNQPPPA